MARLFLSLFFVSLAGKSRLFQHNERSVKALTYQGISSFISFNLTNASIQHKTTVIFLLFLWVSPIISSDIFLGLFSAFRTSWLSDKICMRFQVLTCKYQKGKDYYLKYGDMRTQSKFLVFRREFCPRERVRRLLVYTNTVKVRLHLESQFFSILGKLPKWKYFVRLTLLKAMLLVADCMNAHKFVLCLQFLLPYITYIFNCWILTFTFPTKWKELHIIPLFKCSNVNTFKDLKPVNILLLLFQ